MKPKPKLVWTGRGATVVHVLTVAQTMLAFLSHISSIIVHPKMNASIL